VFIGLLLEKRLPKGDAFCLTSFSLPRLEKHKLKLYLLIKLGIQGQFLKIATSISAEVINPIEMGP
jgi:hypothetical protein